MTHSTLDRLVLAPVTVGSTVLIDVLTYILIFVGVAAFALVARRLLTKFDEYDLDESDSDGKPTAEDLLTRGGYGDPGPGG